MSHGVARPSRAHRARRDKRLSKRTEMANRNMNEQIEKTTDAARNAADEGARTARTVTDEAARVAEQTARAGADTALRGAATARDALNATVDTANDAFRRISCSRLLDGTCSPPAV